MRKVLKIHVMCCAVIFCALLSAVPVLAADFSDGELCNAEISEYEKIQFPYEGESLGIGINIDEHEQENIFIDEKQDFSNIEVFSDFESITNDLEFIETEKLEMAGANDIVLDKVYTLKFNAGETKKFVFSGKLDIRYFLKLSASETYKCTIKNTTNSLIKNPTIREGTSHTIRVSDDTGVKKPVWEIDIYMKKSGTVTLKMFKSDFGVSYSNEFYVEYGGDTQIQVTAHSSAGIVSYEWRVYDEKTKKWKALENNTEWGSSYNVFNVTESRTYACKVTDGNGFSYDCTGLNVAVLGNYTVKFNANGGTCSKKVMEVKAGNQTFFNWQLPRAWRKGYDFLGWSENKKDVIPQYEYDEDKDTWVIIGKSMTLYAIWKSVINPPTTIKAWVTSEGTVKITWNKVKEADRYIVYKWAEGEDGYCWSQCGWINAGVYSYIDKQGKAGDRYRVSAVGDFLIPSGAGYESIESELGKEVTTQCTISYDANGGKNAPASQEKMYNAAFKISTQQPSRTGYQFLGWSTSKTATKASYKAGDIFGGNKTVTLYAVWKINRYKIKYDANGGEDAPASQNKVYKKDLKLRNEKPSRTGYHFLGWSTSKTAAKASYKEGAAYKGNKNVTLYAVWKENVYRINYNANGGKGTMQNTSVYYNKTIELRKNTLIRTGYTFVGWNTKADGTGKLYDNQQKVSKLTKTNNGKITLYAQWKVNRYTISYDANGGIGEMEAMVLPYNRTTALRKNEFSRKGYVFTGWNTMPNGSGKSYKSSQKVSKLTSVDDGSVILYAQWTRKNKQG